MKLLKYLCIILLHFYPLKSISEIIKQVSAPEFARQNTGTQLIPCTKNYPFNFQTYPLYQEHTAARFPNQGVFQDAYIVSVPNGVIDLYEDHYWGVAGLVFINKYFIKECQIKNISPFWYGKTDTINIHASQIPIAIEGSVAICWHLFPQCYGHFILDVLCQLALLEIHDVKYDYLCIPYSHKFMQDLLDLWGIKKNKIIPYINNIQISADNIILPTAVTQTPQIIPFTNYTMPFLIQYVREKLLKNAQNKAHKFTGSKKIFISRKDSSLRNIPNEDEIFKEFENKGFKRYELSNLSVLDQILLFHNADEIVSFVGSGSTNIIFSKPGTKYIEIIQTMVDATFFFLANIMNLDYSYIDNSTYNDFLSGNQNTKGRVIPIEIIQDFLKENPEL
jgi:hypothetical protein